MVQLPIQLSQGLKKQRLVEAVLLRDMAALGQKGAMIKVKPGYMRHTLYPRGVAVYATDSNVLRYAVPLFRKHSEPRSEQRVQFLESSRAAAAPAEDPAILVARKALAGTTTQSPAEAPPLFK